MLETTSKHIQYLDGELKALEIGVVGAGSKERRRKGSKINQAMERNREELSIKGRRRINILYNIMS